MVEPVQVLQGTVRLPGSKSLSNRILLLAALAEGTTDIENLLVRVIGETAQQPNLRPCYCWPLVCCPLPLASAADNGIRRYQYL